MPRDPPNSCFSADQPVAMSLGFVRVSASDCRKMSLAVSPKLNHSVGVFGGA